MTRKATIALLPLLLSALLPISVCFSADGGFDNELLMAVQVQDVPKVKELLGKGADANAVVGDRPLLGWAAQNGNVEIVRALLEAKAAVDSTDTGFKETPLLRAIENGHVEVVKELLKAKANPNAKDAREEPALARAAKGEKPEIVSALVEAGADAKYISPDGDSLALLATQTNQPGSIEIIKILAAAKADLNHSNLIYTPLYYAAELGSKDLVKALLDGGADPNGKTQGGGTPLYAAIKSGEIVEMLLAAKADPNLTP